MDVSGDTLEHNFKCTSSWRMREDGFYLCFPRLRQMVPIPKCCGLLKCHAFTSGVCRTHATRHSDESPFFNLPWMNWSWCMVIATLWISTYGSYLSLVQGTSFIGRTHPGDCSTKSQKPFELKPILLQPVRESRCEKIQSTFSSCGRKRIRSGTSPAAVESSMLERIWTFICGL